MADDILEWLPSDLEVGSVEWWLRRLVKQLLDRRQQLATYDEYYRGDHPLVFTGAAFKEAFGDLFDDFADNWCALVVDAVVERLIVEGFRFGGRGGKADDAAWEIFQRNNLVSGSQMLNTEVGIHGEASLIVWNDPANDGKALITPEHPSQVIVASESGRWLDRDAALKLWTDEDGFEQATLYLPDAIYKFRSKGRMRSETFSLIGSAWEQREDVRDPTWPLPNPLGIVPVVPVYNTPRLLKSKGEISRGTSEIRDVIPLQDGVNKLFADLLVASEFSSFRQRWASGLSIPKNPETGEPVQAFKAAIDRIWSTKSKDAKFGEFDQTDLTIIVAAIEMVVQHIASQTRTPPHYFALSGEHPSGESIKSAETGLVAKSRTASIHRGESFSEAMRLAFLIEGDKKRGTFTAAETIWGDMESRSEAEHADALVKMKAIGVPDEMLWQKSGWFSQQEIKRMKDMKAAQPAVPTPPGGPVPPTPVVPAA